MAMYSDALDLKHAVADQVGNRSISDVWNRLVQQAEGQLNRKLRTVWQITDGVLTFVDGEADLPADFLEVYDFPGMCASTMRPGPVASRRDPWSGGSQYTMAGNKIAVRGYDGARDFAYYAALPTISASLSATNWLLEKFPDCYLQCVSLQAAKYLRDVEMAQATDQLLAFALQELKIEDERHRWSGAIVRVQGLTP